MNARGNRVPLGSDVCPRCSGRSTFFCTSWKYERPVGFWIMSPTRKLSVFEYLYWVPGRKLSLCPNTQLTITRGGAG